MSTPAVSVVMPTYQRLTYLREALDSVLAQTWQDFEVVVSDNSISDAVRELVQSVGDPRVRYRHNGQNIGLQANVLAGYRAARGALLATLHDDDVWEPSYLERLVPPMLADRTLAIAFCDYSVMDAEGAVDDRASDRNSRREGRSGLAEGAHDDAVRLALVTQSIQPAYAAVFRADLDLDAVPADLAPLHDLWIAYLATVDGGRAWYCGQRLTRYRHHGGSTTANEPFYPQEAGSYERFLADPRVAHLLPALRRKKARAELRSGLRLLLEVEDPAKARGAMVNSLRTAPTALAIAALVGTAVPGGRHVLRRAREVQHRKTMTVVAATPARGPAPI